MVGLNPNRQHGTRVGNTFTPSGEFRAKYKTTCTSNKIEQSRTKIIHNIVHHQSREITAWCGVLNTPFSRRNSAKNRLCGIQIKIGSAQLRNLLSSSISISLFKLAQQNVFLAQWWRGIISTVDHNIESQLLAFIIEMFLVVKTVTRAYDGILRVCKSSDLLQTNSWKKLNSTKFMMTRIEC